MICSLSLFPHGLINMISLFFVLDRTKEILAQTKPIHSTAHRNYLSKHLQNTAEDSEITQRNIQGESKIPKFRKSKDFPQAAALKYTGR